jgi:hypothetical protein
VAHTRKAVQFLQLVLCNAELINEPNGGAWGSKFLYKALRKVDPDRLFLIWNHPESELASWRNVIFGPHVYDIDPLDGEKGQIGVAKHVEEMCGYRERCGAPYCVGELHVNTKEGVTEAAARQSLRQLLHRLNERDISWFRWTWKGVDVGDWACVHCPRSVCVDVLHDSYEQIEAAWSQAAGGHTNEPMLEALRETCCPDHT